MEIELQDALNEFLSAMEGLAPRMWIVTNGKDVSSIVVQKSVASYLANAMNRQKKEEDDPWVYCTLVDALDYAYQLGQHDLRNELKEKFNEEQMEGKSNEDDSQLCQRGLQHTEAGDNGQLLRQDQRGEVGQEESNQPDSE